MADQGRWFKLWTTAPYDPKLADLSLEDFARWCLFGTYLKTHGENGSITIKAPGKSVKDLFRVETFEEVIKVLARFPNCDVEEVPIAVTITDRHIIVRWRNWHKYQVDSSSDRMVGWRQKQREGVTSKKRREEKRGEEKRIPPIVPQGTSTTLDSAFTTFWSLYPKKVAKPVALRAWIKLSPSEPLQGAILASLKRAMTSDDWLKDEGRYIPHPATWLNQRRWEDEVALSDPLTKFKESLRHGR